MGLRESIDTGLSVGMGRLILVGGYMDCGFRSGKEVGIELVGVGGMLLPYVF